MSNPSRGGRSGPPGAPPHVFLFAVYPVLFLYAQNAGEVAPGKIVFPMALAAAGAALLWLGLRPAFRQGPKRALAVLALLLTGFYYKIVLDLLCAGLEPLAGRRAPLLAHAALWAVLAGALVALRRSARSFRTTGKALNWVAAALIAWNAGGIALHHARPAAERPRPADGGLRPAAAAERPDIYCFILDEFASLETARRVFRHDHSGFAARLRRAGFFIAEKSRGLYVLTPEAIAAVLNMEAVPPGADPRLLVRRNRLTRFLKGIGYAVYDFPYGELTALEESDGHYAYPPESASVFLDDFYRTLIEMSFLYSLAENWQQEDAAIGRYFRERILYVFERLPEVVRKPGPKFVLVHLFSPHAPFVFDRAGGAVAPEHFTDYSERTYYLEQYLYVSRRVAETAEMIQRASPRPPVIVLLSDHGYRGSFRKPIQHVVAPEEKKRIFLALYLPGHQGRRLDEALSPVDVFRVVLNQYFGQDLPLSRGAE